MEHAQFMSSEVGTQLTGPRLSSGLHAQAVLLMDLCIKKCAVAWQRACVCTKPVVFSQILRAGVIWPLKGAELLRPASSFIHMLACI